MIAPGEALRQVRQQKPLVHHIMNQVTMGFVANGLLALGGKPLMARHKIEAAEAASKADALVLNIGTPEPDIVEAMLLAGQEANRRSIPIVFDPVGVGLSQFRRQAAEQILSQVKPTAICGNAAELSFLLDSNWLGRGVDTSDVKRAPSDIALQVAKQYRTLAILTGQTDVICQDDRAAVIEHGDEWLSLVTGTGCLATSVVAAFLAVRSRSPEGPTVEQEQWERGIAAMCSLGLAAEAAKPEATGPGSFQMALLDALYGLDETKLTEQAKITYLT